MVVVLSVVGKWLLLFGIIIIIITPIVGVSFVAVLLTTGVDTVGIVFDGTVTKMFLFSFDESVVVLVFVRHQIHIVQTVGTHVIHVIHVVTIIAITPICSERGRGGGRGHDEWCGLVTVDTTDR